MKDTRKNLVVGSLPDKTVEAIKEAKMDERHASLDTLMQDPSSSSSQMADQSLKAD